MALLIAKKFLYFLSSVVVGRSLYVVVRALLPVFYLLLDQIMKLPFP